MICSTLNEMLGISCYPLNDEGSVALITTPLQFCDRDPVPVFVESAGNMLRFFDDGAVVLHFLGRGLTFESPSRMRFIRSAVESSGLEFNERGEIQLWAKQEEAAQAFGCYLSAMVGLIRWEEDNQGVNADTALLVDEVALALRAWRPQARIAASPEFVGISGQSYRFDFDVDGDAVLAVSLHHNAVNAALRKLLDVKSAPGNADLKVIAVLDDRTNPEQARRERLVIDALANVMFLSRLQDAPGLAGSA